MDPNGDVGTFGPGEAAALLEQTGRQARRELQPYPPWLLAARGILVLAALGTVWLSVRGQHPYHGPTAVAILVVILFVLLHSALTYTVARRATTGVTGRSRLRKGELTFLIVAWVGSFVMLGVLAAAGVSHGVVYGWYPVTVPLIAAGLAWAGVMAARSQWRRSATGLVIAVVGAAGVPAGPAGAWAVAGVGLCVVLLVSAAITARQQHRSLVGA